MKKILILFILLMATVGCSNGLSTDTYSKSGPTDIGNGYSKTIQIDIESPKGDK